MLPSHQQPLKSARILLAEDNAIQAFDLKALLEDAGAKVVGPAAAVAEVFALAASAPLTCAVLDVILHRELVYPAARMLRERGVPLIFYTGSCDAYRRGRDWPDAHIIMKPASSELLIQAISSVSIITRAGGLTEASSSFGQRRRTACFV